MAPQDNLPLRGLAVCSSIVVGIPVLGSIVVYRREG